MPNPAKRDIREHREILPLMMRGVDCFLIVSSYHLCRYLLNQEFTDFTLAASLLAVMIYWIVADATALYRIERADSPDRDILCVGVTWLVVLFILTACAFFLKVGPVYSRVSFACWGLLGFFLLSWARMLFRVILDSWIRNSGNLRRFAIAGLNPLGIQLAKTVQANPLQGLKFSGFFDDRHDSRRDEAPNELAGYQGKLNELVKKAREGEISTVFITLPMRAENRIRDLLDQLSDSTTSVYIVPDFFVFELLHSRWTTMGGIPAVSVFETPLYGVDGWVKRSLDFVGGCVALLVSSPIMLLIAVAIKITSPGPVFFKQKRYGLDGKEILVWKFRSMTVCENGSVIQQASKNDKRVTPLGAFLRRSSLDELPQLFNVLQGNMSMVGPRPHASAHNEQYRRLIRGYMLRHKVKPGITGLAQVEGCRGETETLDKMERRIELDHRYIREWSIWLDIKILLKTFLVVWRQPTAY